MAPQSVAKLKLSLVMTTLPAIITTSQQYHPIKHQIDNGCSLPL